MTRREREQVVELLRCAADGVIAGRPMPFTTASECLGLRFGNLHVTAKGAFNAAPLTDVTYEAWHLRFLEAAARVEEGSWP